MVQVAIQNYLSLCMLVAVPGSDHITTKVSDLAYFALSATRRQGDVEVVRCICYKKFASWNFNESNLTNYLICIRSIRLCMVASSGVIRCLDPLIKVRFRNQVYHYEELFVAKPHYVSRKVKLT